MLSQCFMSFNRLCCIVLDIEIADLLNNRINVVAYNDDNVWAPECSDMYIYLRNPIWNKLSDIPTNNAVD
jgi:hypothetical protein